MQNEEKQRDAIEEDKTQIEQLKNEKQEKKKIVDQMEKETNKARHDVAALAKEVYNINYQISSIDTKIETKKNERHNILIQNKVEISMIHSIQMLRTPFQPFSISDGRHTHSDDQWQFK